MPYNIGYTVEKNSTMNSTVIWVDGDFKIIKKSPSQKQYLPFSKVKSKIFEWTQKFIK